jgi:predicted Zn-dependent protease
MNKSKRLLILFALMLSLPSCATNPVSKKTEFVLMSEKQELELGRKMAQEVERVMPLLDKKDPLVRYVDFVGQHIAAVSDRKDLYYRFHVVDDATINAFALPGGYIYIHRGLLNHMNSEAELAAVLAHEIGHVTARHAVQRYTQMQSYNIGMVIASIFVPIPQAAGQLSNLLAGAIIQGYGRQAELESDELSIRYIRQAGYDVKATIRILATLERLNKIDEQEKKEAGEKLEKYHGAFSSHPETRKRIEQAVATSLTVRRPIGFVGREPLLNVLNGQPYGDSPKEGAVVGQRFLHPDLGIQLEFPERWVIRNTPAALTARVRKRKVYFQLTTRELQKRQSAREILEDLFPKRRLGPISQNQRDGFDVAHAVARVSAPHISRASVYASVYREGPRAFVMLMWSERDAFRENLADFSSIETSFRHYKASEDGDVPRIRLHVWQESDTWQKLATSSGNILGRFTAERLAALNGLDPDKFPSPGTLIKVVH